MQQAAEKELAYEHQSSSDPYLLGFDAGYQDSLSWKNLSWDSLAWDSLSSKQFILKPVHPETVYPQRQFILKTVYPQTSLSSETV